jgi:phosphoglycolate phosphatase-like HAD superfamily hydrolase
MWAKQLLIFHALFMDMNGLREAEMFFRLHAEHHNLWGDTRGCDRNLAVNYTLLSLLADWEAERVLPREHVESLQASIQGYVDFVEHSDGKKAFGMPSLMEYHKAHGRDFNITRLAAWSEAVNRSFPYFTLHMPPFGGVEDALAYMSRHADLMVVSSTPYCDLIEWWGSQNLTRYVQAICGKEMGKKKDHIGLLMRHGGYAPDELMMIGDGGGDLKAARQCDATFYPTIAGREQDAWKNAVPYFDAFFAGHYRGEMEDERVTAFENALLPKGPWELPNYDPVAEYRKLQQKRIETYRALHPEGRLLTV